MMRNTLRLFSVFGLILVVGNVPAATAERTPVGFSKRDITPNTPLRLSGYSSRDHVFDRVRDPILVRAMVIGDDDQLCAIISIESLAVTGDQTASIAKHLSEEFHIERARVVVSSTHSHATPHPSGAIANLFRQPLSDSEQRTLAAYTDQIGVAAITCVSEAIENRQPASLLVGNSQAEFAVNRRVLQDGIWTGFGVTADGPTDRRVKVMLARGNDGTVLGAMFQYACHCTTLGPDFNELTGDWAGLAASQLESQFPQAVFVPVIGCGGDANPEPRGTYEHAQAHAKQLAQAVEEVIDREELTTLSGPPVARFGYAGLSAELPSRDDLVGAEQDEHATAVQRNWAKSMLATWDAKGRLPESYPAPIHTWAFGDSLVCVFLGGEVVVDYQIRLETELRALEPSTEVWVAAYCDDCFAYVASERMRAEGGYEVDSSMLYYLQPGRWQTGTEDLLVRRVKEVLRSDAIESRALSPEESLSAIRVPDGFHVSLVAAEPLVQDPINLAFDADGSVWVVEMGDYPTGNGSGGRIKHLRDTDGDGVFDSASVFLDQLNYPTSVMPWRDGIIVIAAPDVIFAKDMDGDDRADEREILLSGIGEANPQHRASGFDYGLDGCLYFGAGDATQQLTSHRNGQSIRVDHADVRWNPDSGKIEKLSGATQFVRSRDRFGRWFGNSNSLPLFHYRIDRGSLSERNRNVQSTRLTLDPGVAPPVYPTSRTVDRFNDLFAKDRFTSACSSIVMRGDGLGASMRDTALVCEPVHNLVARFRLTTDQESVRGERFVEDEQAKQDWLTSTDTWFRPVRVIEAPDGGVWVADMVRRVIEHPQWIPDAWQQQMDLRAGEDEGRIYRVNSEDTTPQTVRLSTADESELVRLLASSIGATRDLAMQQIVWRANPNVQNPVRQLMRHSEAPEIRLQAFGTLWAGGWESADDWEFMLADPEPLAASWTLSAAAREHASNNSNVDASQILDSILARLQLESITPLQDASVTYYFQSLLTLADLEFAAADDPAMLKTFDQLLARFGDQRWAIEAVSLMGERQAGLILPLFLDQLDRQTVSALSDADWNTGEDCIRSLWGRCASEVRNQILRGVSQSEDPDSDEKPKALSTSQLMLVLAASQQSVDDSELFKRLKAIVEQARLDLRSDQQPMQIRVRSARLLGSPLVDKQHQLDDLGQMLDINQPGPIRAAALAGAYRVNDDQTAELLLKAWPHLLPDERRIAGATLMQRRSWTRMLVQALVDHVLRLADLDPSTISQLSNCEDYWVMKTVGGLVTRPTDGQRKELIDRYTVEMATSAADRVEGERLYQENCRVCHESSRAAGGDELSAIGPALVNLKKWDDRQWVTGILNPGANVEPKYRQYQVVTTSGQTFAGVVLGQSDSGVQLGLADGRRMEIPRHELETIRDSGMSLMPDAMETKLTPAQMANVIAFLRSR